MVTRRSFLKGIVIGVAASMLPPGLLSSARQSGFSPQAFDHLEYYEYRELLRAVEVKIYPWVIIESRQLINPLSFGDVIQFLVLNKEISHAGACSFSVDRYILPKKIEECSTDMAQQIKNYFDKIKKERSRNAILG